MRRLDWYNVVTHLIFWGITLVPLAWILAFYGYVLRARIALGYWPQPYRPDPKDLDFVLHGAALFYAIPVVACWPAVWVCVPVWWGLRHRGRRSIWASTALFWLSYALWWVVIRCDPGQYVEWFFD